MCVKYHYLNYIIGAIDFFHSICFFLLAWVLFLIRAFLSQRRGCRAPSASITYWLVSLLQYTEELLLTDPISILLYFCFLFFYSALLSNCPFCCLRRWDRWIVTFNRQKLERCFIFQILFCQFVNDKNIALLLLYLIWHDVIIHIIQFNEWMNALYYHVSCTEWNQSTRVFNSVFTYWVGIGLNGVPEDLFPETLAKLSENAILSCQNIPNRLSEIKKFLVLYLPKKTLVGTVPEVLNRDITYNIY